MAGTLHIDDAVITEGCLRGQHGDETEIQVSVGAVITPTGWDYIRDHRLRVVRGPAARPPAGVPGPAPGDAASWSTTFGPSSGQVRQVEPPAADGASIRSQGRFDHPDEPFGCKTDEFGSGYAADGAASEAEFEALVQRITDQIMERLSGT